MVLELDESQAADSAAEGTGPSQVGGLGTLQAVGLGTVSVPPTCDESVPPICDESSELETQYHQILTENQCLMSALKVEIQLMYLG